MREVSKGNYLKELRLKNNLTQKDLGDLVHYSDKNISKWEKGKSFPKDDKTLSDLADALGVTKKDLLNAGKESFLDSKIFKISVIIAIILIVIIIIVSSINKTRVYLIKADNKDIYIENGNYIVNNDYVNFSINYIDTNTSSEISSIELYKYVNNKPVLVHRTNSFPIDIYKRKSAKNSLSDLYKHTTVLKIKYENEAEVDIKLDFKSVKSNYANEENKETKTDLYSESTSVDDYLTKLGFTQDSNSYIKKINDEITISYNSSKFFKLESLINGNKRLFKLSLESNVILMSEYSLNEEQLKSDKLKVSNYKSIDCYTNKCTTEENYVGYLIFLKDKIKSLEKISE